MALLRTELDRLDPSVVTDAFVGKGMDKDGDTLVIGSRVGEIYVYKHDPVGSGVEDDTWTKIATLSMPSGQRADSVAIDGDKIAAGGAGGADGVALFLEPSGGWVDRAVGNEDAYLIASNGDPIGQTSESVVINKESVLASFMGIDSPTAPHGGRAYVFGQTIPEDVTPGTFSQGFPMGVNSNYGSQALLDTDKVITHASILTGGIWRQEAVVSSISGVAAIYGSGVVVRADNNSSIKPSVVALTPTSAVLVSHGSTLTGKARVASISGLQITLSPEFQYDTAGANWMTAHKVDSTRFAVTYQDTGNGNKGTIRIGEVSGTTITYGPEITYHTAGTGHTTFEMIDATTFVITYFVGGPAIYISVGTLSGTTVTSLGAPVLLSAPGLVSTSVTNGHFDAKLLDTTRLLVCVTYNGVGGREARAVIGTISGTSISFGVSTRLSGAERLTTDNTGRRALHMALLGADKNSAMILYESNNPTVGVAYAVVMNVAGTNISGNAPFQWEPTTSTIVYPNLLRLDDAHVLALVGRAGPVATLAYVGEFQTSWIDATEQQILTGSDTNVRDKFGSTMDVRKSDGALIVGARAKGSEATGHGYGGAYLFKRIAGTWLESQKLDPSDLVNTDAYGKFVGINDTVLVILAQRDIADLNSIEVHRESAGTFSLESTFNPTPNDSVDYMVLDADGEKMLIHDALNPAAPGSVLLYAAVSGVWNNDVTLVPNVVPALSTFGKDLQLSSGIAYVGDSTFDPDIGGLDNNGAVYVYDIAIAEEAIVTIDDLIAEVVAISLSAGLQKSYLAKLNHVKRVLNSNKSDELIALIAINMLSAFANHVEAQRNKALTDGEATSLIDGAEALSAQLLQ